jgi:hypothetical protein
MQRWAIAFLLLLVPMQTVWASAARYCAHESGAAAAKHFGHHEHKHQAGGEFLGADGEQSEGDGSSHVDCGSCHLGCAALVRANEPEAQPPHRAAPQAREPRYDSPVPAGPWRPDQTDHAFAVRFGGGVVARSLSG